MSSVIKLFCLLFEKHSPNAFLLNSWIQDITLLNMLDREHEWSKPNATHPLHGRTWSTSVCRAGWRFVSVGFDLEVGAGQRLVLARQICCSSHGLMIYHHVIIIRQGHILKASLWAIVAHGVPSAAWVRDQTHIADLEQTNVSRSIRDVRLK